MSKEVEVILPKIGESITEAVIVQWLKKVGDRVEKDEALLEISTDKVNSEIYAAEEGFIKEIFFQAGETVEVGKTIAIIEKEKSTAHSDSCEKIAPARKVIGDALMKSYTTIPHSSLFCEIDVSSLLNVKGKFTVTHLMAFAISRVLKKFPLLNGYFDNDFTLKKDLNLGIAVNVDDGISVPVIKNCDTLSLEELSKKIILLADKAREKQLDLEEVQGGTITLTNFGMGGALIGTPIIKYPEVAIIGLGFINKKAVVVEDKIVVRPIMMVVLTFDHRVFDGMYGSSFLKELKDFVENYEDRLSL